MGDYSNLDSAITLARKQFSDDLKKNPSDYSNYTAANAQAIQDQITAAKGSAFDKAKTDLGRYMDLQHNVQLYEIRNSDVNRLTTALANNNQGIQSAVARDKDVTRRQFEINEWYNYKKTQTANNLTSSLIALALIGVFVILFKKGILTVTAAGGLSAATAILTGLWVYYTDSANRDPRLWHRRIFTTSTEPPVSTACPGQLSFDITKEKDCLTTVEGKLSDLTSQLNAQLAAYQTGDLSLPPPKSICSA
jgi:hypothetical protein